jgi:hypothetical protein
LVRFYRRCSARTPESRNHDGAGPDRQIAHAGVLPPAAGVGLCRCHHGVVAVEVVPVLDPNEKVVFDGMVSRLRDEDPNFLRKIERLGRPRHRVRLALAILLWTLAPVCIVFGGWTGVLFAVIGVAYGAYLVTKPAGRDGRPAWWSSPNRHPGAPL